MPPSLTARLERFFHRHRRRLIWVHLAMMGLFVALVLIPPLTTPPAPADGILDNYRRLANFVLWGLWFPLVFLSVIVAGRAWCGLLCPMGAASEWANRHGPGWAIPRWLAWPGTPVVSFLVITIWAQTLGVRDHAQGAALLFGGLMGLAAVIGWLWGRNKRAWCRHMCPIGLLLGVYARLGAVDFRPKRPLPGGDRRCEKTACPTMIDLRRKTETRHCIACFRCISPAAKGGMGLQFRRPGTEIGEIARHNPNRSEAWFLFLGAGIALGGFQWLVLDHYQRFRLWLAESVIDRGGLWIGEIGPSWLMAVHADQREVFRWIDAIAISLYMLGWMAALAAGLAAATAAGALLAGRLGAPGRFATRFVILAYQFAPLAMVSLLLGLGGSLFSGLVELGLPAVAVGALKLGLFATGLIWSAHLGLRLLAGQGLRGRARVIAAIPGGIGALLLAAAWSPAIF